MRTCVLKARLQGGLARGLLIQAYLLSRRFGPVRPLALPRNATAYSHHFPLRRALQDATRVDFDAKGLGGVSSEAPLALKARALNALTAHDRDTLCMTGAFH